MIITPIIYNKNIEEIIWLEKYYTIWQHRLPNNNANF